MSSKKESGISGVNRDEGAALLLKGAFAAARREELRGRDKALPDRLVIYSLVYDTFVILWAMVFSVYLASLLAGGAQSDWLKNLKLYAAHIAVGSVGFLFTLTYLGIYERTALLRFRFVWPQIVRGARTWAIGFFAFALLLEFSHPQQETLLISRVFVSLTAILTPLLLIGSRWVFHRCLHRSSVALHLRQRVLFVGWNDQAQRLAETFRSDRDTAYELVGCIGSTRARFEREPHKEVKVLGEIQELETILPEHSVDMVVLTDLDCVTGDVVGLANTCEREMVQFKIMPSYFEILVSGLHLETVSGVPILGVSRLPLDRAINIFVKRAVDVVGAIVGLIIAAPLLVIFGAIVYWESPGPIFYRQRRLGRNGVEFDIIKIRSMNPDAESGGIPGWTVKDDPRRLRIGVFMRRWNIDELPQFWNVFKGEMSLVGPRPERPEFILSFKHEIPHYNARHNCKPGITGWAQVQGMRGDTELEERINCDLWYLENWTLDLDLLIMAMTLIRRDNAH